MGVGNDSVKTRWVVKNDWITTKLNHMEMPIIVAALGVGSSLEEINIDFDVIYRFLSGNGPHTPFQLVREVRNKLHLNCRDNSEPLLSYLRTVSTFCSVV